MTNALHLDDARRRNIRWRILKICDTSRGVRVNEQLMLSVLEDADLNTSPAELRKQAAFLEGKGFLTIDRENGQHLYGITADGTELVEHDAPCPRSIGRPPKYQD